MVNSFSEHQNVCQKRGREKEEGEVMNFFFLGGGGRGDEMEKRHLWLHLKLANCTQPLHSVLIRNPMGETTLTKFWELESTHGVVTHLAEPWNYVSSQQGGKLRSHLIHNLESSENWATGDFHTLEKGESRMKRKDELKESLRNFRIPQMPSLRSLATPKTPPQQKTGDFKEGHQAQLRMGLQHGKQITWNFTNRKLRTPVFFLECWCPGLSPPDRRLKNHFWGL